MLISIFHKTRAIASQEPGLTVPSTPSHGPGCQDQMTQPREHHQESDYWTLTQVRIQDDQRGASGPCCIG